MPGDYAKTIVLDFDQPFSGVHSRCQSGWSRPTAPRDSLALEKAHQVEWCRTLTDLEVQLRRADIACLAGVRDYLPALDLVTTLHQQFFGMRVDGDVAIRMPDEDKVAPARKSVAHS